MTHLDPTTLDWSKGDGLLPAVVQDADSGAVLMVAWMNAEALQRTQSEGFATFYSRSRQRLWQKGETSGHRIALVSLAADCDRDTLLLRGRPQGPACHTGSTTCFGEPAAHAPTFLHQLEQIIEARLQDAPEHSYTARTAARGTSRMAQKVGEEGLEVALAAVQKDGAGLISESADLLFHLLLLLRAEGHQLDEVIAELAARHADRRGAA